MRQIEIVGLLLVVALVALFALASGCGSVTTAGADDAAAPTVETHTEAGSADASTADAAAPEVGPEVRPDVKPEAPTCAPYGSPPYCASCRDSQGICRCGTLPCCNQACQS